jgi:chemotaxis response regulator CheB
MTFDLSVVQPQQAGTPQPQAPPSREQLRQQIQDAIQAARDAARDAAEQARPEMAVPAPPQLPPFANQGPPEGVMVLIIVLASLTAGTLILRPIFKALGSRLERRHEQPSVIPEFAPRLDRIEQAIEAIAVEVERISEGQRYVTKQMHEMRALPAPNPLAQPAMSQRAPEAVRRGEP